MRSLLVIFALLASAALMPGAPALADGPSNGSIECDCGPAVDPPPYFEIGPFQSLPGLDNPMNYVFSPENVAGAAQKSADAIVEWLTPSYGGGGGDPGQVDYGWGGNPYIERDWN
jgi:hypothetical protein